MNTNKVNNGKKIFFQQFKRKKYSVFSSLRKVVHISNIALAYTLIAAPATSIAQDDTTRVSQEYDLEEVEVVSQMSPAVLQELPRLVSVITSTDIEHSPAQSLTDLLTYSANIDLRQRGKAGIQSDLSIRGSSFDHNLFLLNGINISDPQTGHLSLNLPVETQAISRIEILNGPASRVHGANAISGAVNFVTRPSEVNSLSLSSRYGQYDFFSNAITLNLVTGNTRNLVHYNNAFSDGYAPNTDFKRQSVFYHGNVLTPDGILDIQLGYTDRAFGSNSFYTPKYPDQFEENQMTYAAVGYKTGKKIKIHPQVYWRRHRDRWEMFRVDDDWYRVENNQSISNNPKNTTFDTSFVYTNHHINDVMGAKLNLSTKWFLGTTTLGFHTRSENIISNSIGYNRGTKIPVRGYDALYTLSDNRTNFDLHLEQQYATDNLMISAGLLANWNSYLPDELNFFPGIDARYRVISHLSVLGSYNYTLGHPTFTDLTYNDPNNTGNNNLASYEMQSYEGGLQWQDRTINLSVNYFLMEGSNTIDWVWFQDENKFKPINVPYYHSKGVECSAQIDVSQTPVVKYLLSTVRLNYTYMDVDKNLIGNFLKYSHLRQKFSGQFSRTLFRNLVMSVNTAYAERTGSYQGYDFIQKTYTQHPYKAYWLVDAKADYTFLNFTFSLEATNLLDADYIDVGSMEQPGRWIIGGIAYKLNGF